MLFYFLLQWRRDIQLQTDFPANLPWASPKNEVHNTHLASKCLYKWGCLYLHTARAWRGCFQSTGNFSRFLERPVRRQGLLTASFLRDQEKASMRWNPIHTVETIVISVVSMLSDPTDESPANIDAAVRMPRLAWQCPFLSVSEIEFDFANLLCRRNFAMTFLPSRKRWLVAWQDRRRGIKFQMQNSRILAFPMFWILAFCTICPPFGDAPGRQKILISWCTIRQLGRCYWLMGKHQSCLACAVRQGWIGPCEEGDEIEGYDGVIWEDLSSATVQR